MHFLSYLCGKKNFITIYAFHKFIITIYKNLKKKSDMDNNKTSDHYMNIYEVDRIAHTDRLSSSVAIYIFKRRAKT